MIKHRRGPIMETPMTFPDWCIERGASPEVALEWCWLCWAFSAIDEFEKLMRLSHKYKWTTNV